LSQQRHTPQKKWGQNFLRSAAAVEKIAAAVEARPDETVLEIGPGEGVLTRSLLAKGNRVTAIEIDPILADRLASEFADNPNFTLVHADALEAELPLTPFVAVGNLPYNVANPIIRRVIASPDCRRAVFMVQKEVGDRIVAGAGDEEYGFFSIVVALHSEVKRLLTLEPGAFWPRPKVRSSVITFDRSDRKFAAKKDTIIALASRAFQMRRKMMRNSLEDFRGIVRDEWPEMFREAGLREDARPEQLSIEDYDRLALVIERREPEASQGLNSRL